MKLVLFGLNYSPEMTGIGKYSGEMVSWFTARENCFYVITTPPYYPDWVVREGYSKLGYMKEEVEKVVTIRCPIYVPSRPSTIKRLVHLLSFSISSFPVLCTRVCSKPDVIVTVQPTLFCAPFTLLFSKITGAKSVMHIQDFELDAMLGLGMMKEGIVARVARKIESWFLKRFDMVSTISFRMMENAAKKGVSRQKLCFFPNWSDTDFVTPDVCGASLRSEWGFSAQDKVVLYAGNIGKKQGLEIVLDAAEQFQGGNSVHFVLVGSGAHVDILQANATSRGLTNVHFKPLLPWERVPEMLSMADVHLVVQKRGAADAVLPSKLTNILSAGGHALVTAEKDTELGLLADRYPGIYECIEPEDPCIFTKALDKLLKKNKAGPNQVARDYAVEYLSRDKVLSRFDNDLKQLCGLQAK